jgi:hypothetical protein
MKVKTFDIKSNTRLQEYLLVNSEVKHLHISISYMHNAIKATMENDATRAESCFLFEFNEAKVK